MRKHCIYIIIIAIFALFLIVFNALSDRSRAERKKIFNECKISFDQVSSTLIKNSISSEKNSYFPDDFENGILETADGEKLIFDINVAMDIINFSNYNLDYISIKQGQIVEFEYGLGMEFVIYSSNKQLTLSNIREITGFTRDNRIKTYHLANGWYMVQNIVR